MNQLAQKKTLLGMLVAALMCVALLAVAAPQDAYAQQGWNKDSKGYWYEYDNKGNYYKNGWKYIEAKAIPNSAYSGSNWYYFQGNGYAKEGWLKSGKYWYYLTPEMLSNGPSGFNPSYYHDKSGHMVTGWYYEKGQGAVGKGWTEGIAFTSTNSSGRMAGMMIFGEDKGSFYPLFPNNIASGWVYANKSGVLATGWKKISGKWYFFGENTSIRANNWPIYSYGGLKVIDGKTYYFDKKTTAMVTGWQKIDGKWYYFAKSGAMQKNKWTGNYYVQDDGTMATNTWIGKYHVNASGKWDKTK